MKAIEITATESRKIEVFINRSIQGSETATFVSGSVRRMLKRETIRKGIQRREQYCTYIVNFPLRRCFSIQIRVHRVEVVIGIAAATVIAVGEL